MSTKHFHRRLLISAGLAGLAGCAGRGAVAPVPPSSPFDRRSTAEAAPEPRVADLLMAAIGLVGVPYRLGGTTVENGFDCSGFTRHLYQAHLGVVLPRQSHQQAEAAGFVDVTPRFELQPGDLVFFNTQRRANSHVGIYVGQARFVHAPRTGSLVRLESMRTGYWLQRHDGGRRLGDLAARAAGESPRG